MTRWSVRPLEQPADLASAALVDTSFSTERIYRVAVRSDGFFLRPEDVNPPVTKTFPLDDLASESKQWTTAHVATLDDGTICGFAASEYHEWNRRLVLNHLYVSTPQRRKGIARALLGHVSGSGMKLGARSLWLETSNLNYPGVAAYRALGFALCGVDTSLYLGTAAKEEVALFMVARL